MRDGRGDVIVGAEPELYIAEVVGGDLRGDGDGLVGAVVTRDDAGGVLAASLVLAHRCVPRVTADAAQTAVLLVLHLPKQSCCGRCASRTAGAPPERQVRLHNGSAGDLPSQQVSQA